MNTNTLQSAQSGSLHPICSACGLPFQPWLQSSTGQPTKVCFPCGMINLASHCEHVEDGDTLKDISGGEQSGAFFRTISGQPNIEYSGLPPIRERIWRNRTGSPPHNLLLGMVSGELFQRLDWTFNDTGCVPDACCCLVLTLASERVP